MVSPSIVLARVDKPVIDARARNTTSYFTPLPVAWIHRVTRGAFPLHVVAELRSGEEVTLCGVGEFVQLVPHPCSSDDEPFTEDRVIRLILAVKFDDHSSFFKFFEGTECCARSP